VTVDLELPAGQAFDVVGRLVLGGLGARLGLGIDRIANFQQALHAVLQQQPSRRTLLLTMRPTSDDLQVRLGPFDKASSRTVRARRVLSGLVDEIATHESGHDVWVDMRVARSRLTPAGR
jgi:hypothetical protein